MASAQLPLVRYTYKPLSQDVHTRVLEIQPSLDQQADLHCGLVEVNLDLDPYYDALSYAWGEPLLTENLIINATSCLMITSNLRDALLRFRLPQDVRRIWVDALCINQENNEEKSKQIPLMSRIYESASSVVIWLGNDAKASEDLKMTDLFLRGYRRDQHMSKLLSKKSQEKSAITELEFSKALNRLLCLPWFTRRWIVQEAVLNPNVTLYCGNTGDGISWTRLSRYIDTDDNRSYQRAMILSESSQLTTVKAMSLLWRVHGLGGRPGPSSEMIQLLEDFSESQCSDDRDRVYALAGIAHDVVLNADSATQAVLGELRIDVDYTKTVEQVYLEVARSLACKRSSLFGEKGTEYLIQLDEDERATDTSLGNEARPKSYRLFELLRQTHMRSNDTSTLGLSSWATDWRQPVVRGPVWIGEFVKHLREANYYDERLLSLRCVAFHYGVIRATSRPFPTSVEEVDVINWIEELWYVVESWIEKEARPSDCIPAGLVPNTLGIWLCSQLLDIFIGAHTWVKRDLEDFVRFMGHKINLTSWLGRTKRAPKTFENICTKIIMGMRGQVVFLGQSLTATELSNTQDSTMRMWPQIGKGPAHTRYGDIICGITSPNFSRYATKRQGGFHDTDWVPWKDVDVSAIEIYWIVLSPQSDNLQKAPLRSIPHEDICEGEEASTDQDDNSGDWQMTYRNNPMLRQSLEPVRSIVDPADLEFDFDFGNEWNSDNDSDMLFDDVIYSFIGECSWSQMKRNGNRETAASWDTSGIGVLNTINIR